MGKNKEYELAIKIAGEVEKSFYESTKLTKKELQEIAKQAAQTAQAAEAMSIKNIFSEKNMKEIEPFFSGLENVAVKSFKAISAAAVASGAAISSGLVASINVGSEFESAFAGVKKTVNASDSELERMRDNIREMAKNEIPMAAAELSAIAESAGQLGIKNENIIGFTGTMANMNVATDLGSDEAAEEFAKFANITQMSQDYFSNLGSSVVALGNNMATQESNIVGMGMRIAAAGHQVNLSESQIMAYAASLSSVGIEEEAGGSAFSKVLTNLQMATETGKKLKEYADVAGMTGQEFKQAFEDDAAGAINAFLAGLNDTERNGKSAIAVLDEMGLTEVRLRDTLLRAASASDIFDDALELSNKAWNENTALANEASQRYKTFESQCQMTQNKLADLGITVYDNLRPGLTEGISLVNEFIDTNLAQELDSLSKKVPTVTREAREMAASISEFAQPFLAVGGFLKDNPGLLVGTIAGVGTSLATYKVASGISSITKAIGALSNPAGIATLAAGGLIAGITGVSTAVKKAAEDAKKANLAAHFGDISLSMIELQETAAFVVQSQSLDEVRKSMEAMGELDGIAQDISNATRELSKKNWMVSIGMELSADEQEEYQHYIDNYIQSMQDYAVQNQYAITLSVQALLGEDLETNNVVNQLNDFYSGKQQELQALGKELNEVITDAFQDGLLTIDETGKIAELQQQMADIKAAMAGTDFESGLDLLGLKYGNAGLDADSFINLQAEISEQTKQAMADYDEAYISAMSSYRQMLADGGWSQEEYDSAVADLNAGYLQQQSDIQVKAAQFQVDIIKQNYGEEWEPLIRQMQEETSGQLGDMLQHVAYEGGPNVHFDLLDEGILDAIEIDSATRDAMAELYEQMSPLMLEMQEMESKFRKAGMEIPEAVREGLADISAIGALGGDTNAMWELIGETAESPEYQAAISSIKEAGTYLPEEIANAIRDNQSVVNEAVKQSALDTKNAYLVEYQKAFEGGTGFNVRVNFITEAVRQGTEMLPSGLPGHKDGGIFDSPHLAWIAEAGYPESIIPLNGSKEAMDLWLKTGELMGMDGLTGGSEPLIDDIAELAYSGGGETVLQIENSPIIYFYGNAPAKEEIEEILEDENEKFARLMERYLSNNRRTRFYD